MRRRYRKRYRRKRRGRGILPYIKNNIYIFFGWGRITERRRYIKAIGGEI